MLPLSVGSRTTSWEEVDDFMTTYGWLLFMPLPDGFETNMYAAPLRDGGDWIDCLLWTEAERPSDVEISLYLRQVLNLFFLMLLYSCQKNSPGRPQ